MKMQIVWNNIVIVEISRLKGIYISDVYVDNIDLARKQGMPTIFLSKMNIVSKKLPKFIEERIPEKAIRDKSLDVVSEDEGANILRYIKKTNCRLSTDKFEIKLT